MDVFGLPTTLRTLLPLTLFLTLMLSACQSSPQKVIDDTPQEQVTIQPNPATVPQPRMQDFPWMSQAQWYHMHADDIEVAHSGEAELIFLGDSITDSWNWDSSRKTIFKKYFGQFTSANFGIGGDKTQNLLWRLQHGLRGSLDPKVVVILIGVNNIDQSHPTAEQLTDGVLAVVKQTQNNYPNAEIILNGIFPFEQKADSINRALVIQTNQLLAAQSQLARVQFVDFGEVFLDDNGAIPESLMGDFLHPTAAGLERYAQRLAPLVDSKILAINRRNPWISPDDPQLQIMGRSTLNPEGQRIFGYPGVTLNLTTLAKQVQVTLEAQNGDTYLDLLIDGQFIRTLHIEQSKHIFTLFEAPEPEQHLISLVNRSETWHGITAVHGFRLRQGRLLPSPPLPERKLLVLGDSIACGEGIDRMPIIEAGAPCEKNKSMWNPRYSFGVLLGNKLNAQTQLVCYGGRGLVRSWDGRKDQQNLPDFYPLAIADGSKRYPWDQSKFNADLILVAIGTNDFSTSAGPLPNQKNYINTYSEFVRTLLKDHPDAQIVLTEGALLTDEGQESRPKTRLQNDLYATQKRVKSDRVHVVPSRPYAGDTCDAHPTREGHAQTADDFELPLRNITGWKD